MSNEEHTPLLEPAAGGFTEQQQQYFQNVWNRNLYLATFTAVLGPLSFGFVLGYSSPAIPELQTDSNPHLNLDSTQASWFGSLVTVGAAVGGIIGGWIVDKIGRKLTLMSCAVPYVVGFMIIVAARNVWMLYGGRILTGLASGVTSLVVPVYISEMAHPKIRGLLGSSVQLMVVTGIMGAYVSGMVLTWYWLAVLCSLPPTLMVVLMCFMPETPRYLLRKNKRAEALRVLAWLRGPEVDSEWECRQIEANCDEQDTKFALSDLKNPTIYKPLLIGISMMLFQQLSGINAVMFYAESIFEQAHFKNSSEGSVIVGVVQVVFTAVAAIIMDKAGRKLLLAISALIMSISAAVFGVYFKIWQAHINNSSLHKTDVLTVVNSVSEVPTWLPLVCLVVFITGFALGCGPIPWLVMSEIFPVRARGIASGACVLTNWSTAFLVTKEFHDLVENITQYGTFWLFSSFCFMNLLFTIFFVPETKGRTLEQIEAYFKAPT
ncbi:solute carrier family 2, facilitated glucose transporter member 8 isoform X1 [Stegostoma tigrinum]|uniref:solute carrier family 2, facilitated glucose transporter member 8 isoform X1 n=1 Tax=Stegostoma tigrinum TaxID=3053191 RepID=UPI00202B9BA9|nr:solute carrier family 2, facilitated glucose transporter member 8 isoform X1 [Stegostoma tigrinum]